MKKLGLLLLVIIIGLFVWLGIGSRGLFNPIKGIPPASIDWVDFVKLKSGQYIGSFDIHIANPSLVTDDVIGEVEFKVGEVVTNGNYRTQIGDAAALDIGTKLYRIEGFDPNQIIAAYDESRINGYALYIVRNERDNIRNDFNEIISGPIEKIEWYNGEEQVPFAELGAEQSKALITILQVAEPTSSNHISSEAAYYRLVIYHGEPIAQSFTIIDDGLQIFFYTDEDTLLIDETIRQWLR